MAPIWAVVKRRILRGGGGEFIFLLDYLLGVVLYCHLQGFHYVAMYFLLSSRVNICPIRTYNIIASLPGREGGSGGGDDRDRVYS